VTRQQVKHIFDQLLADYVGAKSEVMVDMIVYLNSVGPAFSDPTTYDTSTGLLMISGNTYVRVEQVSALKVNHALDHGTSGA
jgi:hypothetical protein